MPNHTVSGNVDTMMRAADNAGIRSAIGVGTTDIPAVGGLVIPNGGFIRTNGTGPNSGIRIGGGAFNEPALATEWVNTGTISFSTGRLSSSGSSWFSLNSTAIFGWGSGTDLGTAIPSMDLILARDAAGILAQRNAGSTQQFRLYNTTDAGNVNYERLELKLASGAFQIQTARGGAGARRALILGFEDNGIFGIANGSTPVAWWSIATSGHLLCDVNNTYDIGASGGYRPRNVYAGTALISGGSVQVGSGGNQLIFGGRGSISPSADGVWVFYNSASNDFGRLCLGNTTSAFPAIKRNGTGIDIRLADDSAFAPLNCGNFVANGNIRATDTSQIGWLNTRSTMISPSDGVIRLTNNAGTSFTRLELGATNLGISCGTGTPEGIVTALVGSLYIRTDGGASTTLYVKESGTGNTGWVAK